MNFDHLSRLLENMRRSCVPCVRSDEVVLEERSGNEIYGIGST